VGVCSATAGVAQGGVAAVVLAVLTDAVNDGVRRRDVAERLAAGGERIEGDGREVGGDQGGK